MISERGRAPKSLVQMTKPPTLRKGWNFCKTLLPPLLNTFTNCHYPMLARNPKEHMTADTDAAKNKKNKE